MTPVSFSWQQNKFGTWPPSLRSLVDFTSSEPDPAVSAGVFCASQLYSMGLLTLTCGVAPLLFLSYMSLWLRNKQKGAGERMLGQEEAAPEKLTFSQCGSIPGTG